MSQRGPAARTSSSRRSQSPRAGAQISSSHRQLPDDQTSSSKPPVTTIERGASQAGDPGRALGVHTFLNPSETASLSESVASSSQQTGSSHADSNRPDMIAVQHAVHAGPPSNYHSPVKHTFPPPYREGPPEARIPRPAIAPLRSPTTSTGTASTFYPRRILSPKSPRHASLGTRPTLPPVGGAPPPLPFAQPPSASWAQGKPSELPARPDHMRPAQERDTSYAGPPAMPRSVSHPMLQGGVPPTPGLNPVFSASGASLPLQRPGYPVSSPFSRQPAAGPVNDGRVATALMSALQSGGMESRNRPTEPLVIMHGGEAVPVALDFHQGSRQADEKRQRNAGASSRFRARKKEKEKASQQEMNRLESDNQNLARANTDLVKQLDYYKSERNRLREVVRRTSTIRELAEGPPSPTSTRSGGSVGGTSDSFAPSFVAEGSPMIGVSHSSAHPSPLANDPSIERPARRRRTDSAPDAQVISSTNTPARGPPLLPQIAQSTFGDHRPGSARLPPIRLEHPMASPTGEYHVVHTPPPGQSHGPYFSQGPPRQSHPAGWATSFRGPPEGPPRRD